jgi:hypothetical protein
MSATDSESSGYDLFLSYNSADRDVVQLLRARMKERGLTSFFDRESLLPGMPWMEAVEKAIATARGMAVFLGKEGLGRWQKRERALAVIRQVEEEKTRSFPVIPVLLPGVDVEKVPGFLMLGTWIDLRNLEAPQALDALVQSVRGQALPEQVGRPAVELCPYRALRAFREEDADLFFGREAFSENLYKRLSTHKLVAVVGASGSGKSSVVQAGLIPRLRQVRTPAPTWEAAVFTPGNRPFDSLAGALYTLREAKMTWAEQLIEIGKLGTALADGTLSIETLVQQTLRECQGVDQLLLVVDQFEELFTLAPKTERTAFIDQLLRALQSQPIKVVLTLRADFYGQAISESRPLSELIEQGVINLTPMSREELERAIVLPAKKVSLRFEPGLVERILDHVEHQPGRLPLLEFALTHLWQQRQNGQMCQAAYKAMGEIEGAIGTKAEEVFQSLSPARRKVALRLFTRLVRVSAANEEGTDTRRRVSLSQVREDVQDVVHTFVKARLLVTDRAAGSNQETVEVAHEALIRGWELLRQTLDDNRSFLLWRQRLATFLAEPGHDKSYEILLRGPPLDEALDWLRRRKDELNDSERRFIQRSAQQHRARRLSYVPVAVLSLAAVAFFVWMQTEHYLIRNIITNAMSERLTAGVGDNRPLVHDWIRALAKVGSEDEVFEAADRLSQNEQAVAFAAISEVLVRKGRRETAKLAFLRTWSAGVNSMSPEHMNAVAHATEALVSGHPGAVADSLEPSLASPRLQADALIALAWGLDRAGMTQESQRFVQKAFRVIESLTLYERVVALSVYSQFLSDSKLKKMVLGRMPPMRELPAEFKRHFQDRWWSTEELSRMFDTLKEAGATSEEFAAMAAEVVREPYNSIELKQVMLKEVIRSGAWKEVAYVLSALEKERYAYLIENYLESAFREAISGYLAEESIRELEAMCQEPASEESARTFKSKADVLLSMDDDGVDYALRTSSLPEVKSFPSKCVMKKLVGSDDLDMVADFHIFALGRLLEGSSELFDELIALGRVDQVKRLGDKLVIRHGYTGPAAQAAAVLLRNGRPADAKILMTSRLESESLAHSPIADARLVFELLRVGDRSSAEQLMENFSSPHRIGVARELGPLLVDSGLLKEFSLHKWFMAEEPSVALVQALSKKGDLANGTEWLGRIKNEQLRSAAAFELSMAKLRIGDLNGAYKTAASCVPAARLEIYTAILNSYAQKKGVGVKPSTE